MDFIIPTAMQAWQLKVPRIERPNATFLHQLDTMARTWGISKSIPVNHFGARKILTSEAEAGVHWPSLSTL